MSFISISSPTVRGYNFENADSVAQRKPGSNTLQVRKPFVDRTVNCKTPPDVSKTKKTNIPINDHVKKISPCTTTTESLEFDPIFYFSNKEVNEFDGLALSRPLSELDVYDMLASYLDSTTPPPSPRNDSHFDCSLDSLNYSWDEDFSFKPSLVEEEHVYDVEVPFFADSDLD